MGAARWNGGRSRADCTKQDYRIKIRQRLKLTQHGIDSFPTNAEMETMERFIIGVKWCIDFRNFHGNTVLDFIFKLCLELSTIVQNSRTIVWLPFTRMFSNKTMDYTIAFTAIFTSDMHQTIPLEISISYSQVFWKKISESFPSGTNASSIYVRYSSRAVNSMGAGVSRWNDNDE